DQIRYTNALDIKIRQNRGNCLLSELGFRSRAGWEGNRQKISNRTRQPSLRCDKFRIFNKVELFDYGQSNSIATQNLNLTIDLNRIDGSFSQDGLLLNERT